MCKWKCVRVVESVSGVCMWSVESSLCSLYVETVGGLHRACVPGAVGFERRYQLILGLVFL